MSRLLKSKVLDLSIILRLFSAFGLFLSVFVVIVAQILHKEGAWLVVATPPFWWLPEKRNTHTHKIHERYQNDNENDNLWHQKWSVWDTAFFFPFLSLSFPFSCLFLYSSFTLPFPSPFLFPVLFPFLFRFLFHSFPFPFPFLFPFFPFLFLSFSFPFPFFFLSFSFPFPFPFLFLFFSSPFLFFPFPFCTIFYPFPFPRSWILWSRCEASAWKNDKRKNKDNVWKNNLKGLRVFTTPYLPYL